MTVYYAGFIPIEGRYAVYFPDFPGCNTEGSTLEEALAMAAEALSGHMAALAEDGDAIPTPSNKEEIKKKVAEMHSELGFGELPLATDIHPVSA